MELVVAVGLLASVTALLLPVARKVDVVRTEGERRRLAVAELSNLLADLSRLPPEELPAEGPLPAERTAPREAFAASLPGVNATVTAVPVDGSGGVSAVRLDGSLTWTTDAGAAARPVTLSAWAFGSVPAEPASGEGEG